MSLLIRNARVLMYCTHHPARALRGGEMNAWALLERGDVAIDGDRIASVGRGLEPTGHAREIDADGRVLLPGLVDCHTHACWAGDRLDEWELKRAGVPYLEILKRGGGIMSTVRAVRASGEDELSGALARRLARMVAMGSTTIEVKSGYGLSTRDELKMLRAIAAAARTTPATVVPTALVGHAIDADAALAEEFIARTISETVPAIGREFPGIAFDAYCEQGAWSLDACRGLFERARALGHPLRVHADQFNRLGIIELNRAWRQNGPGFVSIDHLEATDAAGLRELAATETLGTLLPCTGFHTDGRYADGRGLIDAGGAAALASNANPGTSPCLSMQMAIALAVRFNRLTVKEAITAATVNAAATLGLFDRGVICAGARADLVLLGTRDERQLAYEFGGNQAAIVICGGQIVSELAS